MSVLGKCTVDGFSDNADELFHRKMAVLIIYPGLRITSQNIHLFKSFSSIITNTFPREFHNTYCLEVLQLSQSLLVYHDRPSELTVEGLFDPPVRRHTFQCQQSCGKLALLACPVHQCSPLRGFWMNTTENKCIGKHFRHDLNAKIETRRSGPN